MISRRVGWVGLSMMLVLATAADLRAGRIEGGTFELSLAGVLDFEGAAGTTSALDLGLGYFVMDGVLAGIQGSVFNDDLQTRLGAFGTLEQHFETDTPWLPYLGLGVGVLTSKTEWSGMGGEGGSDRTTAVAFGVTGGVKFFLTEAIAIDLSLRAVLASDDVFVSDGEPDNLDVSLRIGLRTFLY